MSSPSQVSVLDVDLQPGGPPMLRVQPSGDLQRWAGEHRDALPADLVHSADCSPTPEVTR